MWNLKHKFGLMNFSPRYIIIHYNIISPFLMALSSCFPMSMSWVCAEGLACMFQLPGSLDGMNCVSTLFTTRNHPFPFHPMMCSFCCSPYHSLSLCIVYLCKISVQVCIYPIFIFIRRNTITEWRERERNLIYLSLSLSQKGLSIPCKQHKIRWKVMRFCFAITPFSVETCRYFVMWMCKRKTLGNLLNFVSI